MRRRIPINLDAQGPPTRGGSMPGMGGDPLEALFGVLTMGGGMGGGRGRGNRRRGRRGPGGRRGRGRGGMGILPF